MRLSFVTCIAAALTSACAGPRPTVAPADPIGCYEVTSRGLDKGAKLRAEVNMRIVGETNDTMWGKLPKVLEGRPDGTFVDNGGYWEYKNGSLRAAWTNNRLSGFEILVSANEKGFEGIAQEFWDFPPYVSRKKLFYMKRITCATQNDT
jgi:hypothetical protein